MTQEHKELLLKDLSSRLPYRVKAYVKNWSKLDRKYYEGVYTVESIHPSLNNILVCSERFSVEVLVGHYDYEIKPYLFPLESMTEEQWDNAPRVNLTNFTFESLKCGCFTLASYTCENNLHDLLEFINWLYVNHFDVNGLIPMGLAEDATNLNVY